jgi:hypothetical protein
VCEPVADEDETEFRDSERKQNQETLFLSLGLQANVELITPYMITQFMNLMIARLLSTATFSECQGTSWSVNVGK